MAESYLEKLYLRSPTFIQNALVSTYGAKLYLERYGPPSKQFLRKLQKNEYISSDETTMRQAKLFVELARHAIQNVPFYRRWASDNSVNVQDINSLDHIKYFPFIRKEDVRGQEEDFISDLVSPSELIRIKTSGTTGTPLSVYFNRRERTLHYAFFSRLRSWFGLSPRSRRATFLGRIIQPVSNDAPPFWRYDAAQNNLLMSSYHLSKPNLDHYYRKLSNYQPQEIFGYASSIYAIAKFINTNNLPKLTPKLVLTTAETLLEHQREAIDSAFTGKTIDQYGCAEMAVFASECEYGTMHVHPEHGFVETVDPSGNQVFDESGTVLTTGFVNFSMPLIRYEIGDRMSLRSGESVCACGRAFPIINSIEGRSDDVVFRADGTPVGRLSPVFKGIPGLHEAKVIQEKDGSFEVLIVSNYEDYRNVHDAVVSALRKRIGNEAVVRTKAVSAIQRTKSGKFRAVESRYRPSGPPGL